MNAEAYVAKGLAAHDAGEVAAARAAYEAALAVEPGHADALHLLGLVQHQSGDTAGALVTLRAAVARCPRVAAIWNDLGLALRATGDGASAIESYQTALSLAPEMADAWFNLGNALKDVGRVPEAVTAYQRAEGLKPGRADTMTNLGAAWRDLGELAAAEACYTEALRREPREARAQWNRGIVRLCRGEWAAGWADYEARWQVPGLLPPRPMWSVPEWRGEPLAGRRLLVYAEQGFGDTLQFIRYVPELARRGAEVLVRVQPALVDLVRSVPGVSGVFADGTQLPEVDLQVPLLSVPGRCGGIVAGGVPYLTATGQAEWMPEAWPGRALRVAFAWAGNPANEADRMRSMRLADWWPLLRSDGATFYSVQCGARAADLRGLPVTFPVVDLSPHLTDFTATARVLAGMDLVITVDTAVAHLAGALGRPTWTLLAQVACWRWALGRGDCAWYPTMRLFRQQRPGDWASVMAEVGKALAERSGVGK